MPPIEELQPDSLSDYHYLYMSKYQSLSDLKTRLHKCLQNNGYEAVVSEDQIRLWCMDFRETRTTLVESLKQNEISSASRLLGSDDYFELNTGYELAGEC
jgi:hypothetical protein